jgi:hypothetical protein
MTAAVVAGSAGQLLLKNSPADYDLRAAAGRDGDLAGADYTGMSGCWFDYRAFKYPLNQSQLTQTSNTTWYMPFFNPRPLPITALGTYLTGGVGVGGTTTLALSAVNIGTLRPGALLAATVAPASVTGPTVGPCSVTIPQGWVFASMGVPGNMTGYNVVAAGLRPYSPVTSVPVYSTTAPGWPTAWMATGSGVPVSNPSVGSWQYAFYLPYIAFRMA